MAYEPTKIHQLHPVGWFFLEKVLRPGPGGVSAIHGITPQQLDVVLAETLSAELLTLPTHSGVLAFPRWGLLWWWGGMGGKNDDIAPRWRRKSWKAGKHGETSSNYHPGRAQLCHLCSNEESSFDPYPSLSTRFRSVRCCENLTASEFLRISRLFGGKEPRKLTVVGPGRLSSKQV